MLGDHSIRLLLTGPTLCIALGTGSALAQEPATTSEPVISSYNASDYDLLPRTDSFRLDNHDQFDPRHTLSGDPRLDHSDPGKRIYFGTGGLSASEATASETREDGFFLELNQRGAEFLFRF